MQFQNRNIEYQPCRFLKHIIVVICLALILIFTIAYAKLNNLEVVRTIIGPFFGFIGALFIYTIGLLIDDIEKNKIERDNTKFVYELYKIEINKNISHIQDMIDKKWVPYYRLKTITRDNLWGVLVDYSKDLNFMGKLNDTYGEYELINNKTDIMNSVRIAQLSIANIEIENKLEKEKNNQLSGCIGLGENAIKMSKECLTIIEDKIKEIDKSFFSTLIFLLRKKLTTIFTWLTLILGIIAILPYGLEMYYNWHYRPSLNVIFSSKVIHKDDNSDWLADYSLTIETDKYIVLPRKIFISYDNPSTVPNSHPNMDGGNIGNMPIKGTNSLAQVWEYKDWVIKPNTAISLLTRARLKNNTDSLLTKIVIYAEVEPSDLGFFQLFYHSRLYKGIISHAIDFTGKKDREKIVLLLK